jgi:hypothetical protein
MGRLLSFIMMVLTAVPLMAGDGDIAFSLGQAKNTKHGNAFFRSLHFGYIGHPSFTERRLWHTDAGVSLTYSDIRQPRSWFGHTYGDPNDSVRGENAFFFLRRRFFQDSMRLQPYIDVGTGPMWSNRRVPAATSRFNMNSELDLGVLFAPQSRHAIEFGYKFSHISNGGDVHRNPGWNLHSLFIGTRIFRR